MRGANETTEALFSYVDLEARVPARHPLRVIRAVVNEVLVGLDAEFARMYAALGRPSIAPEKLLRGPLLQAFYTIRSERQMMEQLAYNLLYRWFVGLGIDDPVWDDSTYSKNRDRLLEADIARSPGSGAPPPDGEGGAGKRKELQKEHTAEPAKSEDSAQMQSTSEDKKSRNAEVDFHRQKRSNATHASDRLPLYLRHGRLRSHSPAQAARHPQYVRRSRLRPRRARRPAAASQNDSSANQDGLTRTYFQRPSKAVSLVRPPTLPGRGSNATHHAHDRRAWPLRQAWFVGEVSRIPLVGGAVPPHSLRSTGRTRCQPMSRRRLDHKVDRSDDTKDVPARPLRIEVITDVERRRTWSAEESAPSPSLLVTTQVSPGVRSP